jgi:hypothetical protein
LYNFTLFHNPCTNSEYGNGEEILYFTVSMRDRTRWMENSMFWVGYRTRTVRDFIRRVR